MKKHPQQTRFICAILAIMLFVVFFSTIIFISIITGIEKIHVRDFIETFYILATFYYICRNINKILYE